MRVREKHIRAIVSRGGRDKTETMEIYVIWDRNNRILEAGSE